ncbi:hypothetical protein CC1G_15308 [Coprinopsis cinerea okayama7|uniref:Uncharacterized protein n=1 Tax=Coprinopsis cinerea (strain Okayama-7 / 130 / ATCC MYA-4618 / FGSC 9003) TaxID=240176 RepID=D6RPY7_COPC7|nr:hypothetical protein CC1G_15308 [Coprinopsis cinerea okayama7\|eukprot:XP_002910401.1 hypothetical protein CC1G_15308 [Coprinopsis cinerea okayama7\
MGTRIQRARREEVPSASPCFPSPTSRTQVSSESSPPAVILIYFSCGCNFMLTPHETRSRPLDSQARARSPVHVEGSFIPERLYMVVDLASSVMRAAPMTRHRFSPWFWTCPWHDLPYATQYRPFAVLTKFMSHPSSPFTIYIICF